MSLTIKLRFLLSGLLITTLVVLYAVLTLEGQKTTSLLVREALSRDVAAMHLAAEIKHDFILYDDLVFRFLSTADRSLLEESSRARDQAQADMSALESQSESPTVLERLSELKTESAVYFLDTRALLKAAPRGVVPGDKDTFLKVYHWARQVPQQRQTLGALSAKGQTQLTLVYSLCDQLVDLHRVRIEDAQKQIRAALERSERIIRWGGAASFLAIALIGAGLGFSILLPLGQLQAGIHRILGGDLSFEIPPLASDEIGRITQAFNAMTRQLRDKHEQLLKETITDALTGLANFRHFQEELKVESERARRYDRPLSVLLIDIDHFKNYNDTHGHELGNVVLQTASKALLEVLRTGDILARYGGEEFVALLPETDQTQARRVAERLREAVASCDFPGRETQPEGRLTISVGGAVFPTDAQVAQDLVVKADQALYRAKELGRNRVEWTGRPDSPAPTL
jgi:diguanylate cyclase (GGDEF)-like protein